MAHLHPPRRAAAPTRAADDGGLGQAGGGGAGAADAGMMGGGRVGGRLWRQACGAPPHAAPAACARPQAAPPRGSGRPPPADEGGTGDGVDPPERGQWAGLPCSPPTLLAAHPARGPACWWPGLLVALARRWGGGLEDGLGEEDTNGAGAGEEPRVGQAGAISIRVSIRFTIPACSVGFPLTPPLRPRPCLPTLHSPPARHAAAGQGGRGVDRRQHKRMRRQRRRGSDAVGRRGASPPPTSLPTTRHNLHHQRGKHRHPPSHPSTFMTRFMTTCLTLISMTCFASSGFYDAFPLDRAAQLEYAPRPQRAAARVLAGT